MARNYQFEWPLRQQLDADTGSNIVCPGPCRERRDRQTSDSGERSERQQYLGGNHRFRRRDIQQQLDANTGRNVRCAGPCLEPRSGQTADTVRGSNGSSIWLGTINADGVTFNAWTQIPGGTSAAPAIAWNSMNSNLQIAIKGASNNTISLASANADGTLFSGWTQMPGATSAAPSIFWNNATNKLHLVVKGLIGNLWSGTVSAGNNFNNDWMQVDSETAVDSPSIALNPAAGLLHIVIRKSDNSNKGVGYSAIIMEVLFRLLVKKEAEQVDDLWVEPVSAYCRGS